MFRDLFADLSLTSLPIAAMLLFFAFFLAVLVRVGSKSRNTQYQQMAHLPLDDDSGQRTDR